MNSSVALRESIGDPKKGGPKRARVEFDRETLIREKHDVRRSVDDRGLHRVDIIY